MHKRKKRRDFSIPIEGVILYCRFVVLFFLLQNTWAMAKDPEDKWFKNLSSSSVESMSLYLNNLSPFSDIVVIQRRYLVKTMRFEIAPSALLLFSNEFFINAGLGGRMAFYALEKHGLEVQGFYTYEFPRSVQIDMLHKFGIESAVAGDRTIYFFGLVYKWIPIYGKIAWFDNKIIPFEMSFFLGGGMTHVRCDDHTVDANSPQAELVGGGNIGKCMTTEIRELRSGRKRLIREKLEPTLLFGFGQSYALSRNIAFRLDLNWQYYGGLIGGKPSSSHHWDILMTSGISFYFPRRRVR